MNQMHVEFNIPAPLGAQAGLTPENASEQARRMLALLARAIAERRAALWLEENQTALESSNAYVEQQGLPLAQYRGF